LAYIYRVNLCFYVDKLYAGQANSIKTASDLLTFSTLFWYDTFTNGKMYAFVSRTVETEPYEDKVMISDTCVVGYVPWFTVLSEEIDN